MAWNMAFSSIAFSKGDRILTSVSEYASNFLGYLHLKKKLDISIEVIPNDEYGQTSVDALSNMMDERVRLISITHIPTNNGLVNPAEAIGEIVKKYDCLYLLDACQSIGQYPVDVQKIGCHMLSATGRKYLRAPRGTGFLYVNRHKTDTLTPPFPDLHSADWISEEEYEFRTDARKFENWESNYAGIAGLNAAVKYADGLGIEKIWDRVQYLASNLREALNTVDGITVWDTGRVKSGIVTFTDSNHSATDIQEYLFNRNINVSVSPKNSTLIDMNARNLDELVRASVHYFNTEKEIEILVRTLNNMQ
jgi:selenocysteine lyase/cysteine desulfurase